MSVTVWAHIRVKFYRVLDASTGVAALTGAEESVYEKEFTGKGRIGKVMSGVEVLTLKPEDLSSPIALQMALSRILEAAMKIAESGGPKPRYVAEIRFVDDLGNAVSFAVDLGETMPPFSSNKVKARIIVELYDEED